MKLYYPAAQRGYSLLELLVALLLSSALVLGISTGYSSITGLIQTTKNLENAQEVLRFSSEVFTRSIKQSESVTIPNAAQLNVNQTANSIACDGLSQPNDFIEIYTLDGHNLKCQIDANAAQIILTGVEKIVFEKNEQLMSIKVTPQAVHGEKAGALPSKEMQIDIALTKQILINATRT